ncbi:MAG: nucleotidyltransferase family protein [Chloroflexota bacterium]|nr:nucleotidyltransferase family protein [Chloroflexota bacterium]
MMIGMKAMILAAGVGSRLRPLTDTCPKPMLPIAGQPLLAHTLDWLERYGVKEAVLNLHHLPDLIQRGLGDGSRWNMRLHYSVEPELRGTAGATKHVAALLDETFVVVYGDLLVDLDLDALLAFHRARNAQITLALKHTDDPRSQGMIATDRSGRVHQFVEKPTNWPADQYQANAGVYLVEPAILDRLPDQIPLDWGRDVLPDLIRSSVPIYAAFVTGKLIDIGSHVAYVLVRDRGLTIVRQFTPPT